MEYIKKCHVFKNTNCNCPENICRRDSALKEAELLEYIKAERIQERINDIVDFQIFLYNKGLITNTDWSYTELGSEFISKRELN